MSDQELSRGQKVTLKKIKELEEPTNGKLYENEVLNELFESKASLRTVASRLRDQKKYVVSNKNQKGQNVYELSEKGERKLRKIVKRDNQAIQDEDLDIYDYSNGIEMFTRYWEDIGREELGKLLGSSGVVALDYKKLEHFDPDLADDLLENPEEVLKAAEESLTDYPDVPEDVEIRVANIPDVETKEIDDLSDNDLNKLITVEGVLQSATPPKLELEKAKFECRNCASRYERKQDSNNPKSPYKCECGHRKFDTIDKEYATVVMGRLKDKPEKKNRKTIPIKIKGDLATDNKKNLASTGQGFKVIGYLEPFSRKRNSDLLSMRLIANNVEVEEDKWEDPNLSENEIEEFEEVSEREDVRDYLVRSLDHENIHGLELMREAFLLFYLSRTDDDNTHFLCIGEPSTGKSQLSMDMKSEFPRTMRTVADGASKVGLTGAVVKNEVTNEWHAEAGAIPMADGGFHITDEVDKLPDKHYSAFNEALSDQTVSLNKANIRTTLSADVSEFAIGNPKNRKFDSMEEKYKQNPIDSADLNSRFGVIFAVEQNKPGKSNLSEDEERKKIRKINDRYNTGESSLEHEKELLSTPKVAKYVAYAQDIDPELTEDATEDLEEMYIDLWSSQDENQTLIDMRVYQALRNLSVAYARMELEDEVSTRHVSLAKNFMGRCFRSLDFDLGSDDASDLTNPRTDTQKVRMGIENLQAGDGANVQDVIDEVDVPEEKAEKIIEQLKNDGEFFDSAPGKVKAL